MFEKEAEEYSEINSPFLNKYDCIRVFRDGAEFGYNKCKEEINQKGLALQSDMDRTIEQNFALKKELEKTEWHYVKDEIKKKFEEWIKENGGTDGVLFQTFSDEDLEHIFMSAYAKNKR